VLQHDNMVDNKEQDKHQNDKLKNIIKNT